jgi:hypothetical protein
MKLRRLPGRLRGFLGGASLWAAADYILSVTSYRFREDYRRFYFRDIQAIVVTRSPRYLFSIRSAVIAMVLVFGCFLPQTRIASALLLLACAVAWWILSWRMSCVCRVHTAVSSEVLRSIYRVPTARKFLAEVEPLIRAAQSGLPDAPPGEAPVAAPAPIFAAPPAEPRRRLQRRTAATLLLLFLVLADAAATAADLALGGSRLDWLMTLLLLAQVGAVVWMIVQHRAASLARPVLLWGLGFLIYVGGMMYAQTMVTAFDQARSGKQTPVLFRKGPGDAMLRQLYIGGCTLFAAAGAFVMFRPAPGDER